jgi:LPXTG-motif cell wall-anchored protein
VAELANKDDGVPSLPITGGMGTKLLYILGAALITAGITIYLKKRKEKK